MWILCRWCWQGSWWRWVWSPRPSWRQEWWGAWLEPGSLWGSSYWTWEQTPCCRSSPPHRLAPSVFPTYRRHTQRETWLYRYSGTSLVILLQEGQLFFSSCRQFNPWKKDTSLIRTLSSVQQVSIIGSHSEFCKHLNVLADDFKDPGEGCVFARDCDVDTRDGDSSCHFHCNLIVGDHPHRTMCGL